MNHLFFILAAGLALTAQAVRADDPAVPGTAFPVSRYEVLWTKSPFAVATPEAATDSPDYSLVGVARDINGIYYASLVEKQNNEHFLISSDKMVRGLTLTSITRNPNSPDTYALVQKDGQTITLKLEQSSAGAALANINNLPPGMATQQLQMPGAGNEPGLNQPFRTRFRRGLIHLPPEPGQQQSVQVHSAPPPLR